MCLTALADPTRGATVLLPQPVFPLYTTICQSIGVNFRFYRLKADKDWEVSDKAVRGNAVSRTCVEVYMRACVCVCVSMSTLLDCTSDLLSFTGLD